MTELLRKMSAEMTEISEDKAYSFKYYVENGSGMVDTNENYYKSIQASVLANVSFLLHAASDLLGAIPELKAEAEVLAIMSRTMSSGAAADIINKAGNGGSA